MGTTAELILGLVLKYGPVLTQQLLDVAHKTDPTLADWTELLGKVKTYEQLRDEAFAAAGKIPTPLPPVGGEDQAPSTPPTP